MICEVAESMGQNLFLNWMFLNLLAVMTAFVGSGYSFYRLYWNPSYELWRHKSNPKFPRPESVRTEILLTLKCISLSTVFPALTLYLAAQGKAAGFCGWGDHSLLWHVGQWLILVTVTDFYEWAYHYAGHQIPYLWAGHKSHHRFYNPTPFAVIADEAFDQIVRSAPMLAGVFFPINMDVLFLTFSMFLYGYGIYLHCGYEFSWPDAHHPIINTSFQHYLHHAEGAVGKPRHTGFFVKLWDKLVDGDSTSELYKAGNCKCAKCAGLRGERSFEAWKKVEKPDYSPLLKPSFYFEALFGSAGEKAK